MRLVWVLIASIFVSLSGTTASALTWKAPGIYTPSDLDKLNPLPEIRHGIEVALASPAVPEDIKEVIKDALASDLQVIALNPETRSQYGVRASSSLISNVRPFFIDRSRAISTLDNPKGNFAASARLWDQEAPAAPKLEHVYTIFNSGREITPEANDLVGIVHELAHIYFDAFLNPEAPRLALLFPEHIQYKPGVRTDIDPQLYDYLSERFAFETEFRFLRAGHKALFTVWDCRYQEFLPDEHSFREIIDFVAQAYGITDPRILAFNHQSLRALQGDTHPCTRQFSLH